MQQWEYLEVTASGLGSRFVNVTRGKLQSVGEFIQRGVSHIDPKLDPTKSVKIHVGGVEVKGIDIIELLDLLGADGWNLVAIKDSYFYLKRPVSGQ